MRPTPQPHWLRQVLALSFMCGSASAQSLPPAPISPEPVVTYEYDAEDNLTRTTQAPGAFGFDFRTTNAYDALNRLATSIDAQQGETRFTYDGLDRFERITDPRDLVTRYERNGLGDAGSLVSPDTGTAAQTYDAAGNLATRRDSRGALATYTYDALNRLTRVFHQLAGQPNQAFLYSFDQVGSGYANGVGRLTRIDDPSGAARYLYDAQGRLIQSVQGVKASNGANTTTISRSVRYGHDPAGRLSTITYPSGRQLRISYRDGQFDALSLAAKSDTAAVPIISQIEWEPFGPVRSWQWHLASGMQLNEKVYDPWGRIVRYRLGDAVRDVTYDAADRIAGYTHYDAASGARRAELDQSFSHDELDRLTDITTSALNTSISYDANGNRTQITADGVTRNHIIDPASNRLNSISNPARTFGYDDAGNTTADTAGYSATYDASGRLAALTKAGVTTTYSHNALGQRVRKFSSTGADSTVIFVYGQNGLLLGEYGVNGAPLREYVWLNGTPVAMITPDPANATNPPLIYHIHTDHLDAPRVVTDRSSNRRWSWRQAVPFGNAMPDDNPDNLGVFVQPLRFPGQYADVESGLFYNHFRDYDPSTGRYVQSDPIGLRGGINTYAYVGGNPLSYTDASGLNPAAGCLLGSWAGPVGCGAGAAIGTGVALAAILMVPSDTPKGDVCPPAPGGKDPCKGLRDQLLDHERKLREYTANPMSMDNKGFLAGALAKNDQNLYNKIYMTRLVSLQGQIANFKKQLEECERQNGR
jgi:RHS repeat-associated protein